MTSTDSEALMAILDHHRSLEDDVSTRVGSLRRAVEAGAPYEPAASEPVEHLGGEVPPHAPADGHSIYRIASAWAELVVPRPDRSVRLTAALHQPVGLATAGPAEFRPSSDGRRRLDEATPDAGRAPTGGSR